MKYFKTILLFLSPFGLFLIATSTLGQATFKYSSLPLMFNENFFFSVAISLISTFIAICLGAILAFGTMYKQNANTKKIFEIVLLFPHIGFAYLVFLFFSDEGVLARVFNSSLGLMNDKWGLGIIINYTLKEIPFVYLVLLSTHTKKLKKTLLAAKLLGASKFEMLTRVYIPLIKVPLGSTAIIIFAFVLGNYEVPALLGNPSVKFTSVSIIENFQSISEVDNKFSYFQVLILFICSLLFSFLINKRRSQ